jgi:hypothetical protein
VVQGIVLLSGVIVVAINLVVDIAQAISTHASARFADLDFLCVPTVYRECSGPLEHV